MWKNPKNILPDADRSVCVLYQHNKKHKYFSTEMMAGIVEYSNDLKSCRVNSEDFTGKGSWCVYLQCDSDNSLYEEYGLAWCYCDEFNYPEWIPHDSWWKDYGFKGNK